MNNLVLEMKSYLSREPCFLPPNVKFKTFQEILEFILPHVNTLCGLSVSQFSVCCCAALKALSFGFCLVIVIRIPLIASYRTNNGKCFQGEEGLKFLAIVQWGLQ